MNPSTAEEFRISQCVTIEQDLFNSDIEELMVNFAKLHCKAQLEAILENAEVNIVNKKAKNPKFTLVEVDKASIKNAYDLTNIK